MRSTAGARDDPAEWDVARPARPSRVPGVSMAGFGVRSLTELRMVPHPAVTLLLEFGAGRPEVDDAAGRRERGSLVAGPGFGFGGAVRARGEKVACVQVRLSPVVARAVLGAGPADLARVAADGGYADRSHLHREVRAFTGTTPTSVAHEPFLTVDDVAWPGPVARVLPHRAQLLDVDDRVPRHRDHGPAGAEPHPAA